MIYIIYPNLFQILSYHHTRQKCHMKYVATMLSVGFLTTGNSSVFKLLKTVIQKGVRLSQTLFLWLNLCIWLLLYQQGIFQFHSRLLFQNKSHLLIHNFLYWFCLFTSPEFIC